MVPVCALIAYVTPSKGIVQFVKVPDVGVPKTGVTKVGDVSVPVALVKTRADGVPNAGVTKT